MIKELLEGKTARNAILEAKGDDQDPNLFGNMTVEAIRGWLTDNKVQVLKTWRPGADFADGSCQLAGSTAKVQGWFVGPDGDRDGIYVGNKIEDDANENEQWSTMESFETKSDALKFIQDNVK